MQNPLCAFHTLTVVSLDAEMMFLPPQQSWMSFTQSVWCSMDCRYGSWAHVKPKPFPVVDYLRISHIPYSDDRVSSSAVEPLEVWVILQRIDSRSVTPLALVANHKADLKHNKSIGYWLSRPRDQPEPSFSPTSQLSTINVPTWFRSVQPRSTATWSLATWRCSGRIGEEIIGRIETNHGWH